MKKLLIISNTFYPDPAVASVRMTQWAKHLPLHGWAPLIACRDYGYPISEKTWSEEFSSAVRRVVVGGSRAAAIASPPLRKNFRNSAKQRLHKLIEALPILIPDVSVRFWESAIGELSSIIDKERPSAILTTSPPHSIHKVGLELKRRYPHIPWLADFRDPFMMDNRFAPEGVKKLRFSAYSLFEERVYKNADIVIHAIPPQQTYAAQRWPELQDKFKIVENGCPDNLLELIASNSECDKRSSQRVCIVGERGEHELEILAQAIRDLHGEYPDAELRVVGRPGSNFEKITSILGDKFVYCGFISHSEALREISNGNVLVSALSSHRSESWALSSKLFEYLATGRPILSINPTRSDLDLLDKFSHVKNLKGPSIEEVRNALRELLTEKTANAGQFIDEYSRSKQVANVASILNEVA